MDRTHLLFVSVLCGALALAGCNGGDTQPDADADIEEGDVEVSDDGTPGTPGITVEPTEGLRTTEAGGDDTFTIVLDSQPTADVTIELTSSDETEGTVSPDGVTFTPENWDAPQEVTVTGVDDEETDGTVEYAIETAAAASDDEDYDGLNADDVTVENTDDETAGITVEPTEGLRTTEAGGEDAFTIVLNAAPTADVTIELTSSDETEGTVSPDSVTFTAENWDAPQEVTVTGVDDEEADGTVEYAIETAPATSDDGAYDGLDADDVTVENTDDESAGITVEPTEGLRTTERGGDDTFTIVLNTAPTADVTIGLSSSDETEGTVSPDGVTFTPENWDAPQTATVTGVDDELADGNQTYTIETAPAASDDEQYDGVDADDVEVENVDDETAGITVEPTEGLTTTEAGGEDAFTIVLNAAPSADVTVGLSSSDETEGTVSPASVTFTPENWDAPQTVTVTGADDEEVDGNQAYTIETAAAASTDAEYEGIDADDVSVTNVDDETAGITVEPTSGLVTTEGGGSATFTIVLNAAPDAEVTIGLTSDDESEGTVSPASVTFTTADWNAPQTVTVTGVDDDLADGNQPYVVVTGAATSTDADYAGLDAADVSVTNVDDETAGITVNPTTGLVTTEGGGEDAFTIVLNAAPAAEVSIGLASSDTTEGTASPTSVTFTPENWNAPQTVTVTGADDDLADGNQPYVIRTGAAVSADAGYEGLDAPDVSVTNTDDDSPGITVEPAAGLVTTEEGGEAFFTIVLNSEPFADVTIGLSSSDTTEGTVSPSSVTFTPVNWRAPQTVTVEGVDDDLADGNQPYTVVTAPAETTGPTYAGLNAADVSVSNTDNDSAGITVTPTSGLVTTEEGGEAFFTIVLNSEPYADVTIGLTSSDTTEGTVSPSSVTFTAVNWRAPQTVTVEGVDDGVADGNQPYLVVTAPAVSTGPTYSGRNAPDVSVTNVDDDSAGITVDPPGGLVTTEIGGEAFFTIVLTTEPTADVRLSLSVSDATEATVSPREVTFTPVNWRAPQIITVEGLDDDVDDGDQPYLVHVTEAESADPAYDGIDPRDVTATNADDDTAGITVEPTSGLVTTEVGGEAFFTIVLDSEPTHDVTIGLTSSAEDEGTVSPVSVTFTALNWNAPRTVTVEGVNDDVDDGDQPYTIVTAEAESLDPNYDVINPPNVGVTNNDDDTAGITVEPTSGLVTTEAGGTDTFTIVLDSEPTADVTIGLTSSAEDEGTVSPSEVTFTALNWNAPRTVTVTGEDDDVDDGDQPYTIVTAEAESLDPNYDPINPPNVSVTNNDDDTAGITLSRTSGLVTTEAGGTDTFTIVLDSEPTAAVTIGLTSSAEDEGTVSPSEVTFTAGDWDEPQTVTVTGVNDDVDDGDQPYTIVTAEAVSGDPNYDPINPPNVGVTNSDDDTAGITVDPTSGLVTTEAGGTATFTITLDSEPTASVTIDLTSSDPTEGTVAPSSAVLTSSNWDTGVLVTVTGVDDAVDDGDISYAIQTAVASSGDGNYNGRNPPDVSVTNTDDDEPIPGQVIVSPTSGLHTMEPNGATRFTLVLDSAPTANVTVGVSSSDTTEGTVSTASVTFTTGNWSTPKTVTVTAADDTDDDGEVAYTAVTADATSTDPRFSGIAVDDVSLTNYDNDLPSGYPLLISVNTGGSPGNGQSWNNAISGNGAFVAFASAATDLVAGDTNGSDDMFVRDVLGAATTRASVAWDGSQSTGTSYGIEITPDARYVNFNTYAANLVPGDTNGKYDTFVRDRVTPTTIRTSLGVGGVEANNYSTAGRISTDGRYATFSSEATNLVAGDTNGKFDVFVRDLVAGTTARASLGVGGAEPNDHCSDSWVTDDGRYVSFHSSATNLVADDTNGVADLFVHDLVTGLNERVNVGPGGVQANAYADQAGQMTADGRYVAFYSSASNLVAGDTNGAFDVFVHDRTTHTTERVSLAWDGAQGSGSGCFRPYISADGRYVVFMSVFTNLVPGDTNGTWDVFLRDRVAGRTYMLSVSTAGVPGNGISDNAHVSDDGVYVSYGSAASNLVAGDTNGQSDVFLTVIP